MSYVAILVGLRLNQHHIDVDRFYGCELSTLECNVCHIVGMPTWKKVLLLWEPSHCVYLSNSHARFKARTVVSIPSVIGTPCIIAFSDEVINICVTCI